MLKFTLGNGTFKTQEKQTKTKNMFWKQIAKKFKNAGVVILI